MKRNQFSVFLSVARLRVRGAGEGRGSVAGQVWRGPALSHQEEPGGPHTQAHADLQGEPYSALALSYIAVIAVKMGKSKN